MTSRAPVPTSLHSLLGAIVAATLAGCVEQHDDMMAVTQLGPETIELPLIDGREGELLCIGYGASRVNGLAPDVAYDSLAYYLESAAGEPELVELAGEPCASAPDRTSCLAEVERVRRAATGSGFPVAYALLVATGVRGPEGASAASSVSTIDDIDELLALLGRIDTPNEAALAMSAGRGSSLECNIQRDGRDYVVSGSDIVEGICPPTMQRFELRITPDGVYSETPVGAPYPGTGCVGRRPDGLCVAAHGADVVGDGAGDWLARTARLEMAAVAAFLLLARELEALGAPSALLGRLRAAASEEIAHAQDMTALARARGAEPSPAIIAPPARRSLLEIAIENAVEGCVRECWGALCARFQAAAAGAADVRAAFARIALEEAEHAQLSRDVAAWLDARLAPSERARVATARRAAIEALRSELDREPPGACCRELGVPNREQALSAFDALERTGLLHAA